MGEKSRVEKEGGWFLNELSGANNRSYCGTEREMRKLECGGVV